MNEPVQVELDPAKNCNRRFEHRDVQGDDRPEGRVCPACASEPSPEPV